MKSPSSPFLSAALAYAKRGWPVFPLKPRDKPPIPTNGFKAATTDRDMILAWWTMYPTANVGITTGTDSFDVLDIDGRRGYDILREFLFPYGIEYYHHDGPLSLTGKGWHLLFAPTGQGNRVKLLDAPLDYRGNGGYIVAPPSIHPLGHPYRWDTAHRRTDAKPLPPAPPWLIDLLATQPRREPKPNGVVRQQADGNLVVAQIRNLIAERRPDIINVVQTLGITVNKSDKCHCPFHEDDTPSMQLYPEDNTFYCYGCHALGDSINLASRRDMNGKHFL